MARSKKNLTLQPGEDTQVDTMSSGDIQDGASGIEDGTTSNTIVGRTPNALLPGLLEYPAKPIAFIPTSPCTGLGWFHPKYSHCAPNVQNPHRWIFFRRDQQWFMQEYRSKVTNEARQEKVGKPKFLWLCVITRFEKSFVCKCL